MAPMPSEVFELEEGEEVGCYFCMEQGDHRSYKRGEAFLAGPDHSPCDGNANYVCRAHLDADAIIGRDHRMNIGIVGAEGAKFTREGEAHARQIIRSLLSEPGAVLVSGHCHLGGVDIWAEEIAAELGCATLIFPPARQCWEGGYKQRNLQIVEHSDFVHCIAVDVLPGEYTGMRFALCYHCAKVVAPRHVKSGGCWTMRRAQHGALHVVANYPAPECSAC